MAVQTITIDTANSPFVYPTGEKTEVSGVGQTFSWEMTDLGTTADFNASSPANSILLLNGDSIRLGCDGRLTRFGPITNATARSDGSFWIETKYGYHELKIVSVTITDADAVGANNVASIKFEYPGTPYNFTWTNIQSA